VRKRIVNILKYVLALSLLTYVVWSNWGDPRGTAGKIIVGAAEGQGKLSGTVVDYQADDSIRIRTSNGEEYDFALKPKGKTKVVNADGLPLADGQEVKQGETVTVADVSRGLAYVWKRHVIERQPIHAGFLALAFVFGLSALMLTFLRWYILVRAVDLPFRLADAIRLGFIGFFFNTLMPGSVGGDAIKAWFLAHEQTSRRTTAVATVIMDRVIALWALVWFVALLGSAFWLGGLIEGKGSDECKQVVTIALAIVGTTFAGWVILTLLPDSRAEVFAGRLAKLPKVGHAAAEFWRAAWVYHRRPKTVFGVLMFTWLGHIGFILAFYCSMRTLCDDGPGQEPSLMQHFLIVPIGMVIQAIPLFPGGAGIGELGYGLLYQWLGYSEASGVLGSLVQRVLYWFIAALGLVVYLRMRSTLPANETAVEMAAAEA
jgi:glycosyltransferase 2 family protein